MDVVQYLKKPISVEGCSVIKWSLPENWCYDKKLPWVYSVKHLGTTLTDVLDDMDQDLLEKQVQYIA